MGICSGKPNNAVDDNALKSLKNVKHFRIHLVNHCLRERKRPMGKLCKNCLILKCRKVTSYLKTKGVLEITTLLALHSAQVSIFSFLNDNLRCFWRSKKMFK